MPEAVAAWVSALGGSLDRDADVPVGVQLAWALRARIARGDLLPGDRLPPLRVLAERTSLNVNTVRAVYARLEHEGLLASHQGRGTFVAAQGNPARELASIAERAARAARQAGVDVRDVAAALYVGEPDAPPADAGERRRLREQVAALGQALDALLAVRPQLAERLPPPRPRGEGPRLLGLSDLEEIRDDLLERLAALRREPDEPPAAGEEEPAPEPAPAPQAAPAPRPGWAHGT